jgi:hypothetical protein
MPGMVQEEQDLAYWLRGVMQLCIYPPLPSNPRLGRPRRRPGGGGRPAADTDANDLPVAWSCAEEAIMSAIRDKDPLGLGLPSPVALRLLQVGFFTYFTARFHFLTILGLLSVD